MVNVKFVLQNSNLTSDDHGECDNLTKTTGDLGVPLGFTYELPQQRICNQIIATADGDTRKNDIHHVLSPIEDVNF